VDVRWSFNAWGRSPNLPCCAIISLNTFVILSAKQSLYCTTAGHTHPVRQASAQIGMCESQPDPSSPSDSSSSYGYDSVYQESIRRHDDIPFSSGSSDSYDYGSVHEASGQRFLSLTQSGRSTWDDPSLYDESDPTILDQAQGTPPYRDQDSTKNHSPSLPPSPSGVDLYYSPRQGQVIVDKSNVLPSGRSTPDDVSLSGESNQVISYQLRYHDQARTSHHSPPPPPSPTLSSPSSRNSGADIYRPPERTQIEQSSLVPAPLPPLSAYGNLFPTSLQFHN